VDALQQGLPWWVAGVNVAKDYFGRERRRNLFERIHKKVNVIQAAESHGYSAASQMRFYGEAAR
jgi:hypothetical protein